MPSFDPLLVFARHYPLTCLIGSSNVLRVVPAWQQLLCEELELSENSPGPRRLEVVSIQVEEVLFLCGALWKTFCFCMIAIILGRLPSLNIRELLFR